ncbi:hypothetical protein J22TS1_44030 [Siminovitchia terrae]|uniref:hypothetical protein n=1 Tax=Siminovitchia terrae TaxID=1914933 RepID=UPI001B162DF5|nr:hypothetical protein [Siminovitchia terrae]GIN93352.1 hypothetical protein J22TS1_44030 [Siminovitchia terrae]
MALAVDSDKRTVMQQIGKLLDQCRKCPKSEYTIRTEVERAAVCGGCAVYAGILEHRAYLGGDDLYSAKVHAVLAKGAGMTKSDIVYLLEKGVNRRDIQKATGLSQTVFRNMLINYGLSKSQMPVFLKTDRQKVKINSKLTPELYKEYKAKGMTDHEIKFKYGIGNSAFVAWKRKHFTKDELKKLNLKKGAKKS